MVWQTRPTGFLERRRRKSDLLDAEHSVRNSMRCDKIRSSKQPTSAITPYILSAVDKAWSNILKHSPYPPISNNGSIIFDYYYSSVGSVVGVILGILPAAALSFASCVSLGVPQGQQLAPKIFRILFVDVTRRLSMNRLFLIPRYVRSLRTYV